jgi:NADPH:quinone reductase-like Zn-dependent oxidoreductase/acyl carrier protein
LLLFDDSSKLLRLSIAPENGEIRLNSRQLGSSNEWTHNFRARIMADSAGLLLTGRAPECPDRAADFSRETHIALAKSLGLEYGPHFQAISHGWIEQGRAIGLFEFPDVLSNEMSYFLLHPGILDSVFQLFIPLLANEGRNLAGVAFVPVRVGRIQLARKGATSTPMLAQVELVQRSPHSLLANVGIFDDKRRAVAVLQGVRFKAIALRSQRSQKVSYLDYYLTPFPLPEQQQPPGLESNELARNLQAFYQQEGSGGTYAQEIEPLLDSLVQSFMVRTLEEQLCNINCFDTLPGFAVARWLVSKAAMDGLISVDENGVAVVEAKNEVAPEIIWEGLLRDYPDYFVLIHLVGRFGLHLGESLKDPERIADIDLGQKLYSRVIQNIMGPGGVSILAEGVANCVATMVRALFPGRRLAVTEVGADSPLFASAICRKLDFGVADYSFISPYLESNVEAGSISDDFPLSRLTSLALDSGALGDELPKAHVLIVHLDFLSMADARRVLQLSIGWVVDFARVILVSHHPAYWLERIFGAGSASLGKADHSQQMAVAEWQKLLSGIGYENVLALDLQGPEIGSALLSCTAPKWVSETLETESIRWMVVAGKEGFGNKYAERICAALSARGGRVYRVHENSPNLQEHVWQAERELGAIDRVVFLDGIGNNNLVDGQTERCKLAAALVQACDKSSTLPVVWLLTQGVADMYVGTASTPPAADTFFWGFARTLINEASGSAVRLLDLPTGDNAAWPIEVLLETLSGAEEEQEVFILSDGARMSSRLKLMKPPGEALGEIENSTALTLESRLPGQLKDLRWIAHELRQPKANEVEIDVSASGLNFRDVMYSLGYLPDEAVENGLSGPTLGLEFAGRVVSVGADVSTFAVGDDVVGFGPASFSTRLIAQETSIAKIPFGLGYEAAVTIPTTFFTAYYALKYLAHLEPGERVLIHGAAGGVGIAAIQVAQWLGAEIYATVGSQEKRDFLKLLGVDNIFNSRSLTFAEELMAQTPDASGVDVILNCLSGEAIAQNLRALKPFGRFLELGKRDFFENTSIGLRPFRNNISYFAIDSDQLMKDRPDLAQALYLEVMDRFDSKDFYSLPYTLFTANQVIEAFRYVQQARQIGKVVIGYGSKPLDVEQNNVVPGVLSLSPEKTYLVTGGLSGFGLRTAQWLVEKGARYLVLISRNGLNTEGATQAVEELEAQGVTVVARSCDVTNRDNMLLLLAECAEVLPPIKGVVHAAAVFNDGLAANLSSEQIRDVLGPKVSGAWNLHELTKKLDFFVLFSSATTLFGNPGQASYVGANHWLEALAVHRRNIGESVNCVRWGPIDDVGFLARNPGMKETLMNRMGGDALSSETALRILEQIILSRSSSLGVMELDWSVLRRFMPASAASKYREISGLFEDLRSDENFLAEYENMVHSLSATELKEAIARMLGVELGTILLIPAEKIDMNRSLYDMGIDSLMGLELVTAIDAKFGVQFSVMVLSEASTLYQLAELMIKKLNGEYAESNTQVVDEQHLASKHGVELGITG